MGGYLKRENRGLKANWYRLKTSLTGIKRLVTLSKEDKQGCIDGLIISYKICKVVRKPRQEDETKAVAAYYKVLNNMLSVFDLEKLYFPPQLDVNEGLYGNQILCEQDVMEGLNLQNPEDHASSGYGLRQGANRHTILRP